MRRIVAIIITVLALAAPAAAQEGNPCQAALDVVAPDPNQLAFHITDLDKTGVTSLTYLVMQGDSTEPVTRATVSRAQLQATSFPLCYTLTFAPATNLLRDGTTRYYIVARTEDATMRVSAWSARSNPFVLGKPTIPDPLPLPVPGVRVGRTGA